MIRALNANKMHMHNFQAKVIPKVSCDVNYDYDNNFDDDD